MISALRNRTTWNLFSAQSFYVADFLSISFALARLPLLLAIEIKKGYERRNKTSIPDDSVGRNAFILFALRWIRRFLCVNNKWSDCFFFFLEQTKMSLRYLFPWISFQAELKPTFFQLFYKHCNDQLINVMSLKSTSTVDINRVLVNAHSFFRLDIFMSICYVFRHSSFPAQPFQWANGEKKVSSWRLFQVV